MGFFQQSFWEEQMAYFHWWGFKFVYPLNDES